jgi:hypothetical protein
VLGVVWSFESGFSGFFSVVRWYGVLNQDLQDLQDFLALCVVWSFESGFTGFPGFFSVVRWYGVLNQDLQDF